MRNLKLLFVIILTVVTATTVFGQKMKVKSGTLKSSLKGAETILFEFKYDDMTVGKMTEVDYLAKKKKEYNEKEAGRGDKWEKSWKGDREKRFEPSFEKLFNKYTKKSGVLGGVQFSDAKYKIIIHTTFTEPGYYVGISSRPAKISGMIYLVETANPDVNIATISFINSPGNSMGATWDAGERIKESYAKLAKTFIGLLIKQKAFK